MSGYDNSTWQEAYLIETKPVEFTTQHVRIKSSTLPLHKMWLCKIISVRSIKELVAKHCVHVALYPKWWNKQTWSAILSSGEILIWTVDQADGPNLGLPNSCTHPHEIGVAPYSFSRQQVIIFYILNSYLNKCSITRFARNLDSSSYLEAYSSLLKITCMKVNTYGIFKHWVSDLDLAATHGMWMHLKYVLSRLCHNWPLPHREHTNLLICAV